MTNSGELVRGLYKQYEYGKSRTSPDPVTFVRPHVISYDDGTSIVLERITTHLPKARCDKVAVKTVKGIYVLNDMTDASVLFIDGGHGFECSPEQRADRPTDYFIFYGSVDLELRNGLYSLLHEFGHVDVDGRAHRSTAHNESAAWDKADKLAAEMGLVLFDSEIEQRLHRDICVRTYDLHDRAGIAYGSVVRDIHFNRFGREVIYGLLEAAKQGLPLEAICTALLTEVEKQPET